MKTRTILIMTLGLLAAREVTARDLTAFELIKAGDPYVGIQSKDKVLQIHSAKSVIGLTPDIWYVAYYDPDAIFKFVEVKFAAGNEESVSHPIRPFQLPFHERDILAKSKLKVDSDRALKIAQSQPLIKKLTLKASRLALERSDEGPVWKIRLWAAKLNHPDKEADIGVITLSATDGSVVRNDLHPGKVD